MQEQAEFTLVGRGALARACAQRIIERGWPIRAFVSNDPEALAWAGRQGLRRGSDLALLGEVQRAAGSILLSVSNDRLIPAALLDRFALAINFHDAPLPQYSGSHATSWALMAREREYSITWHRMTSRADAGEILSQVRVPLAADETAFSLNGKCHEAALASFPQLLDRIGAGSLEGRPQNPARRVFYPRDRRPDRLAVLDFRRPAHDLEALARALSYGDYPNRLALPKLWTGEDFIIARRIEVKAARSRNAPGTVLLATDGSIDVSTSTHDVRLLEMCGLDGERAVELPGAGTRLPVEGGALDGALAGAAPCHWRDEEFWTARWGDLKPLVLPVASGAREESALEVAGAPAPRERMLADVLAWLRLLTGMDRFDVGLRDSVERGPLVACVRPFRGGDALDAWEKRGPCLREALLRDPRVPLPPGWRHFADWPVVVGFGPSDAAPRGTALEIGIDSSSGTVRLRTPAGGIPLDALREWGQRLAALRAA